MRKTKIPLSIRIDPSVLGYFKAKKPVGYQSLIHEILAEYVEHDRRKLLRNAGRAQELFRRYHSQCFWHYKSDLVITEKNIELVIEGLKKYGGNQGLIAAEELCQ